MVRRRDRPAELVRVFGADGLPDARRVVVVHPGALPTGPYAQLAEAVRPWHRLHVVDLEQVPEYFDAALTGGRATTSIDELAERVAVELRTCGLVARPWILAGWSFGGVVGYAVTALLAESELPDRLLLLDSIAPVPAYIQADDDLDTGMVLGWFAMYLAAKRGGAMPIDRTALEGADLATGLQLVLDAGLAGGVLLPGTTVAGLRKVFGVYTDGLLRNNRLAGGYRPAQARVPATLIRPENGLLSTSDPLGWGDLVEELTTTQCPGDHYSMLSNPAAVATIAGHIPSPVHN